MNKKDTYVKRMQAQLDAWDAEIKKLKAKAEIAQADTQLKYQKEVEELQERQRKAEEKLSEIRAASDDAWADLKSGADRAWDAMSDAIKAATGRFK